MRLKKFSSEGFIGLENISLNINNKHNFLLLNTDCFSLNNNIIWDGLRKMTRFDLESVNDDIGCVSITYETDGITTTYKKCVTYDGSTTQEILIRNDNLVLFIDHLHDEGSYINSKEVTKEEENRYVAYKSIMGKYPIVPSIDESLENFLSNITVLGKETDCIRPVSKEAKDLAEKIIINSDLGIKEIRKGSVVTLGGFEMGFSSMGTGAKTLLIYLPTIIDCVLYSGVCVIDFDFCSRFHPILLRSLVDILNQLTKKYNSQVIMTWYERDKDYFLSTGTIEKENIVLLSRTTESLIIE